jgi:hypothetical protein
MMTALTFGPADGRLFLTRTGDGFLTETGDPLIIIIKFGVVRFATAFHNQLKTSRLLARSKDKAAGSVTPSSF